MKIPNKIFILFLGACLGLLLIYISNKIGRSIVIDKETGSSNGYVSEELVVPVGERSEKVSEQLVLRVTNWEPKNGKLSLKDDSGKEKEVSIDVSRMWIMLSLPQRENNGMRPLTSNSGSDWDRAFCPEDTVTLGFNEKNDVNMVLNTGFRACAYYEE